MRFVGGVALLLAALAIAPAVAEDLKASDNPVEAVFKAMSFQDKLATCLACHGANGVSATEGVPSLAGQPVNFTEYQLIFFRYEQRKDPVMTLYGRPLTDEEIQKFGDYFAALPPPPAAPDNDPALTKAGKDLDNGNCEICHLRTGKGDTPNSTVNVRTTSSRPCTITGIICAPAAVSGPWARSPIRFPTLKHASLLTTSRCSQVTNRHPHALTSERPTDVEN